MDTHATIILDAYKGEKIFRPKIIIKRAYKESKKSLFKNAPTHKTRIRLRFIFENHLKRMLIFYH